MTMRLYYHQTSGGAEYLTNACLRCEDGTEEGIFEGATIIVRLDGTPKVTRLAPNLAPIGRLIPTREEPAHV